MACPFFHPIEPLSNTRELRALPLGDFYRGQCHAGDADYTPSENELRTWCNFGYARHDCAHFPAAQTDAPDVARFSIGSDNDSGIIVRFTLERDHRPLDVGAFQFGAA